MVVFFAMNSSVADCHLIFNLKGEHKYEKEENSIRFLWSLCQWVLCQLDTGKSHLSNRNFNWENVPQDWVVELYGIFLICDWCGRAQHIVCGDIPRLVVLDSIRKPVSSTFMWPLHPLLFPKSCHVWVFVLVSFNDELQCRSVRTINPFSITCFLVMVFPCSHRNTETSGITESIPCFQRNHHIDFHSGCTRLYSH